MSHHCQAATVSDLHRPPRAAARAPAADPPDSGEPNCHKESGRIVANIVVDCGPGTSTRPVPSLT
jgi:hypothetical protein